MKILVIFFITLVSIYGSPEIKISKQGKTSDGIGDIYHLLRQYRYPTETHWVQTLDGYVLRMQRITKQDGSFSETKGKPAVLLMHGLMSSAVDWVNLGPNNSLALVLADAGFDVWLGNNRGTTWSRQHVKLNPDVDAKFWDFSFEECGMYDLPAKIDYIINKTGQQKIFYVGHSQGTSQFFAMAALRPEYNDKIELMTALAPAAYMTHLSSPLIRLLVEFMGAAELLADFLHIHELFPHSTLIGQLGELLCSEKSPEKFLRVCDMVLLTMCGYHTDGVLETRLPILAYNEPAGISLKMLLHYGQEIGTDHFGRYDYGLLLNLKHYDSFKPPEYDISAITAPIAIYYSQNDFFVAMRDVEKLAKQLPNLVELHLVEDKYFNHLDFIFARNVNEMVNVKVLNSLKEAVNARDNGANCIFNKSSIWMLFIVTLVVNYL